MWITSSLLLTTLKWTTSSCWQASTWSWGWSWPQSTCTKPWECRKSALMGSSPGAIRKKRWLLLRAVLKRMEKLQGFCVCWEILRVTMGALPCMNRPGNSVKGETLDRWDLLDGITSRPTNSKKPLNPSKMPLKPITTIQTPGLPWAAPTCEWTSTKMLCLASVRQYASMTHRVRLGETSPPVTSI